MLASDRPVTLHAVVGATFIDDAAFVERVAEARGIASSGLLAIVDAWQQADALVLAIEESPSATISLRSAASTLSRGAAARLVVSLCHSLEPIHRAGLAHGVVAPDLVTLDASGSPSLAGLGVATLVGPTALLRATGMLAGRYLAPEQIREGAPTARSDVHALAAMLHEMIGGVAPFDGDTASSLWTAIATEPPAALPASTPAALTRVLLRALAKDPSARFADAGELASALTPFVTTNDPVRARGPADDEVAWSSAVAREGPAGRRSDGASPRHAGPGRTARFTGALAHEQLAYARSRHPTALERSLASMAPAERDEIASATAVSWVRVDSFARFHDAFARELGRPVEETHAELVAGASRKTFGTLWRMLLRVGGTRLVMTRAPVVYGKTYDTGTMQTRDVGDHGGTFVLSGWPDVPDFVLRGLRAGMTVGLENVGRTGVVLTSSRTSDGAIFTAQWES